MKKITKVLAIASMKINEQNALSYQIKDGVLCIQDSASYIGISFSLMSDRNNKKIHVFIPENLEIRSMNIDINTGDLNISNLNTKNLHVDIFDGDVEGRFSSCPEKFHIELVDGDAKYLSHILKRNK